MEHSGSTPPPYTPPPMLSPMRSGSGLFCAVKRGLGGFISPQSAPVFPRLAPARPAGKRRASVTRLYNVTLILVISVVLVFAKSLMSPVWMLQKAAV